MNRFLGNVARDMTEHGLMATGPACLLVAVSGGVDSVVLLEVLHRLSGRGGWRLVVAHFNHQLRGAESDGDEQFVQALAKRLGWQCVVGRAAWRKRAMAKGGSLEMRAREARHQFLAETARTSGAACVALGHHADDQAELFLLRMLRGAGSEGFAGMKWSGPSSVDARVRLIRPLLGRSREEIQAFARDWDLASRDDSSNDSTDMLRNRIRKVLIPLLEKDFQPGLRRLLTREADVLGAEAEYLAQASEEWLRGSARSSRRSEPFGTLPLALQRRVLVSQLLKLGLAPEFELVESLRRHPEKNGGAVRLPTGKILQRTKAGLVILRSRGRDGRRLWGELSGSPRAQRRAPARSRRTKRWPWTWVRAGEKDAPKWAGIGWNGGFGKEGVRTLGGRARAGNGLMRIKLEHELRSGRGEAGIGFSLLDCPRQPGCRTSLPMRGSRRIVAGPVYWRRGRPGRFGGWMA